MKQLTSDKVSDEELDKVKQRVRTAFLFDLDNPAGPIKSFAHDLLLENQIEPPEEYLAKIETVTPEDIQGLAQELFQEDSLKRVGLTAEG